MPEDDVKKVRACKKYRIKQAENRPRRRQFIHKGGKDCTEIDHREGQREKKSVPDENGVHRTAFH